MLGSAQGLWRGQTVSARPYRLSRERREDFIPRPSVHIKNPTLDRLTAPRLLHVWVCVSETRELVIFSKLSFGRAYELMVPIGNVISSLPQLDHKRVPHPRHDG